MNNKIKKLIPKFVKEIIRMRLVIKHKGDKYICPICDYNSDAWYPIGWSPAVLNSKEVIGAGLRNGGCYNCKSTDRERLIYTYLKYETNFISHHSDKKVLHVAPEILLTQKLLDAQFNTYICGDLFTKGYSYPKHVVHMNVLDIPHDKETFDLIICNHVLEHIVEDAQAISELYRVLKNDGTAILQVPISNNSPKTHEDFTVTNPKDRETIFGQYDHVRLYGQDYVDRLQRGGFKVRRINISEKYSRYGVNSKEDLFICFKI